MFRWRRPSREVREQLFAGLGVETARSHRPGVVGAPPGRRPSLVGWPRTPCRNLCSNRARLIVHARSARLKPTLGSQAARPHELGHPRRRHHLGRLPPPTTHHSTTSRASPSSNANTRTSASSRHPSPPSANASTKGSSQLSIAGTSPSSAPTTATHFTCFPHSVTRGGHRRRRRPRLGRPRVPREPRASLRTPVSLSARHQQGRTPSRG
jgi:hypothetical protein